MFLGASLLAFNATLASFLSTIVQPADIDTFGIFDRSFRKYNDYIIVGGGTAGAIIATRLSEEKHSVLLLEAGGSDYETEFTRIPATFTQIYQTDKVWRHYTNTQKHAFFALKNQQELYPSGKMLGGSSSLNGMLFNRGCSYDFDRWEREGCKGWSYNDVLPYFKKLENMTIPELRNSVFHGKQGPLTITGAFQPIDLFHERAAAETGFQTIDCNEPNPLNGYCRGQYNIKNGERCSSVSCFLRPILHRPNLQVNIRSHVTKVIIRNGRAVGVQAVKNGQTHNIFTRREVVLSAGVVGSPQILMLSGIGPRNDLQRFNIPIHADLPVGRYFTDHAQMIVEYSMNVSLGLTMESYTDVKNIMDYVLHRKGVFSRTPFSGLLFARFGPTPFPEGHVEIINLAVGPAQILSPLVNYKPEIVQKRLRDVSPNGFFLVLANLHPKSHGVVQLISDDPFHQPRIDPNYLSHPDDVEKLLKMIRVVRSLEKSRAWRTLGVSLKRFDQPGYCNNLIFDTDEYWRCIIRSFGMPGYHGTGTCRMGAVTDPTAVVDPQLRVKGIRNLRVADASIMRNIVSGGTNAATMMIGEKAADLIKGRHRISADLTQIVYKIN